MGAVARLLSQLLGGSLIKTVIYLKVPHTYVPTYALILRVVSFHVGLRVSCMRTLTRLFAAGAGILRARDADRS
jgi:hypothetical protein